LQLVLASNNAKKLAELQSLLTVLGIQLVTQQSLGIPEADEPHATFVENALVKARHAAQLSGVPSIADDSGLCVHALGGAPGVQSARFAPKPLTGNADRETQRASQDAANNALLLRQMQNITNRRAWFVSTLVAVRAAHDPEPLIAVGRWFGEILHTPRGVGGFGYDPLMFIPALGCAAAELSVELKNTHSHRAEATAQMLRLMSEVWALG
jgi:XTP/dITP diphosphohydrolase